MRGHYGNRRHYGNRSLVGADAPDGNAIQRSLARYESDRNKAFSIAQSTPGNFIGLQMLQPVDERGVVIDEPTDYKAAVLPSRASLDDWFASITYETRAPGYSYDVMGIDKTQPMTVTRPDGTHVFVSTLGKTLNVPKLKPRSSSDAVNYALVGSTLGGAVIGFNLAKKRRVAGGVFGGVLGILVGAVLSRLDAKTPRAP